MFLLEIWRRITTSRRTREREAAANRENAERESALREGIARRTHALEAQIAQAHAENCRLRAENRALLNSVLGIAGIPPVIVAEPAAAARKPAVAGVPELSHVGAQHAVPGAHAWRDALNSPTAPPSHSRHTEEPREQEPLFDSTGGLEAKPERGPSLPTVAQDDGVMADTVAPNGPASPSSVAGHSSAVPLQKQSRRTSAQKDPHAIAPIRRRSWHQIYRMLEFESSRRKDQDL